VPSPSHVPLSAVRIRHLGDRLVAPSVDVRRLDGWVLVGNSSIQIADSPWKLIWVDCSPRGGLSSSVCWHLGGVPLQTISYERTHSSAVKTTPKQLLKTDSAHKMGSGIKVGLSTASMSAGGCTVSSRCVLNGISLNTMRSLEGSNARMLVPIARRRPAENSCCRTCEGWRSR